MNHFHEYLDEAEKWMRSQREQDEQESVRNGPVRCPSLCVQTQPKPQFRRNERRAYTSSKEKNTSKDPSENNSIARYESVYPVTTTFKDYYGEELKYFGQDYNPTPVPKNCSDVEMASKTEPVQHSYIRVSFFKRAYSWVATIFQRIKKC